MLVPSGEHVFSRFSRGLFLNCIYSCGFSSSAAAACSNPKLSNAWSLSPTPPFISFTGYRYPLLTVCCPNQASPLYYNPLFFPRVFVLSAGLRGMHPSLLLLLLCSVQDMISCSCSSDDSWLLRPFATHPPIHRVRTEYSAHFHGAPSLCRPSYACT